MESCLMCTVKHIFSARAKANEIHHGYAERFFSALGELAEAANECAKDFPAVAAFIRDQRLQWEQDCNTVPNWTLMANQIAYTMQKAGKLPKHFMERVMGLQCGMRCDSCDAAVRGREDPRYPGVKLINDAIPIRYAISDTDWRGRKWKKKRRLVKIDPTKNSDINPEYRDAPFEMIRHNLKGVFKITVPDGATLKSVTHYPGYAYEESVYELKVSDDGKSFIKQKEDCDAKCKTNRRSPPSRK